MILNYMLVCVSLSSLATNVMARTGALIMSTFAKHRSGLGLVPCFRTSGLWLIIVQSILNLLEHFCDRITYYICFVFIHHQNLFHRFQGHDVSLFRQHGLAMGHHSSTVDHAMRGVCYLFAFACIPVFQKQKLAHPMNKISRAGKWQPAMVPKPKAQSYNRTAA